MEGVIGDGKGKVEGWNETREGVERNRGGGWSGEYELSLHNLNPICSGLGG